MLADATAFCERIVVLFSHFAFESPDYVEWDSLDVILSNTLWDMYKPDDVTKKLWKVLIDIILRFATFRRC